MRRGFTLLEVMVATLIMGIAVAGLMGTLSTSVRNAARLTEYDRVTLLARRKMDELLVTRLLPKNVVLEGRFGEDALPGQESGWRARVLPFERPERAGPGTRVLDRVELQIWWGPADTRRTFTLDAFRPAILTPQELQP